MFDLLLNCLGYTYHSSLNPLVTLQKKLLWLITFSKYNNHTNLIFINLNIVKLHDLVYLNTALFMCDFYHGNLCESFISFFLEVSKKHSYSTRLAFTSSYSIPKIKTIYGKFNIRLVGTRTWNLISEQTKKLKRS